MNIRTYIGLLAAAILFASCGGQMSGPLGPNGFELSGALAGTPGDSLYLYAIDGFNYKKIGATSLEKGGDSASFSFRSEVPRPGFYWIGTSLQNTQSLPLGGDKVRVSGNGGRLNQATIFSPTVELYKVANQKLQELQAQSRSAESEIINGGPNRDQFISQATALYDRQKALVDSLITINPIVGKSLQLELMPPFIPGTSPAKSPQEHYATSFLSEVDFTDPDFAYMPLPDKVQEFTSNLTRMGLEGPEVAEYLGKLAAKLPAGSITQKNVLARMVYALEVARHSAYPVIVEKYLAIAPSDPRAPSMRQNAQALAEKARREAAEAARFAPGNTPPEIALPNPNGKVIKLSSLKGKVVMIDFWASWCGPCRRENPNVVKLYQKYNNKGFEILGVSLDKDKQRWLKAIEEDNLDWLHVSDLKFWQCEAAQAYGVSGIPATFLLDRDGKMIAKGLRGAALEQKLAEIFGA